MLFAFEKLTATSTLQGLSEDKYTISDQVGDYALYTLEGGDIRVVYDGSQETGGTIVGANGSSPLILQNREMIKGFRFILASGTPVLNIQYASLEWPDLRTLFVPRLKRGARRKTRGSTQEVKLGTGAAQRRRTIQRPLQEFEFESLDIEDGGENEIGGFYSYHQGDIPFYLHAHRFSTVLRPQLVGYGDAVKEDFYIPARFILPYTLKIFLDGIKVDGYSVSLSSGLISFFSPPGKWTVITASYSRWFKCLFTGDELADEEIPTTGSETLNRIFKIKEIIV